MIVLDHLTETQKRAYIIADNRLALNAGWDDELLALELQDLKEADFNLDLTGFDVAEIDQPRTTIEPTKSRPYRKIRFRGRVICGFVAIGGSNIGCCAALTLPGCLASASRSLWSQIRLTESSSTLNGAIAPA